MKTVVRVATLPHKTHQWEKTNSRPLDLLTAGTSVFINNVLYDSRADSVAVLVVYATLVQTEIPWKLLDGLP